MKKAIVIILLLHIWNIWEVNAQKKVNIGEKCPNIRVTTLMNYQSKEAEILTAFNDKPLIIDFWFIHCPPCIEFIPKLDSLQKAFNNQFNILLVTHEKKEDIENFLKENEHLRPYFHPIIHSMDNKSILRTMFPHSGEPHDVWIDKNGIVKAITSGSVVTPANIAKFLKGDTLDIEEKMDVLDPKYYGDISLMAADEELTSGKRKLYYSWMGSFDPKRRPMTGRPINPEKNEQRIIAQNLLVSMLYTYAYSMYRNSDQEKGDQDIRIEFKLRDSLKFKPDYESRARKNIYCYELYLRDTSEAKIKKLMQRDLDSYFDVKSSIKQENTPCYILTRLKKESSNSFEQKDTAHGYVKKKGDSIYVKNVDIYAITNNLLGAKLRNRVINETGYDGKVDLVIPQRFNREQLRDALNKYGLELTPGTRKENIVIVQDPEEE